MGCKNSKVLEKIEDIAEDVALDTLDFADKTVIPIIETAVSQATTNIILPAVTTSINTVASAIV